MHIGYLIRAAEAIYEIICDIFTAHVGSMSDWNDFVVTADGSTMHSVGGTTFYSQYTTTTYLSNPLVLKASDMYDAQFS